MARSITDPGRQADALTAVAQALAQAGQGEQAEQVARSITAPYWRAAESVASSIATRYQGADALTTVAQALAQAGSVGRARRVAAAACQTGRWSSVVDVVLRLSRAADVLSAQHETLTS